MTHIDVKAYAMGEISESDKRSAATHVASCEACREELKGMEATLGSLAMLRDEEVPRRIAFVSDKVFEPRWWERVNPMFASACVIAVAIVAHGFAVPPPVDASVEAVIDERVAREMAPLLEVLEFRDRQMTQQMNQMYKTTHQLVTY